MACATSNVDSDPTAWVSAIKGLNAADDAIGETRHNAAAGGAMR